MATPVPDASFHKRRSRMQQVKIQMIKSNGTYMYNCKREAKKWLTWAVAPSIAAAGPACRHVEVPQERKHGSSCCSVTARCPAAFF